MSSPRSSSSATWQDETITPPSSPPPLLKPNISYSVQDQENRAPQIDRSSIANAFSLLGKRKERQDQVRDEVQPATKRVAMSLPKQAQSQVKTQMQLSLGQKVEKKCNGCGMLYILSSAEDRKLHDRYHKRSMDGYEVGKQLLLQSMDRLSTWRPYCKNGAPAKPHFCIIKRGDAAWKRRHAREVLDIMTTCLGACEIPDEELWSRAQPDKERGRYEMHMLLIEGKCVTAALVETAVSGARFVEESSKDGSRRGSSLDQLRRRREAFETDNCATLTLSTTTCPAQLGISRIWTAPNYRHRALAHIILHEIFEDYKRANVFRSIQKIGTIAFSQPTTAGTKLARSFFQRQSGWMVY